MTLVTSEGDVHCAIEEDHAPTAAAHFLAWADGSEPFLDARSGAWTRAPLYRDLAFFRALERGYVQSGCQLGDGTSTPGFRFPVEARADDARRLSSPGAIAFVTYRAPPDREDPAPPPPGDVVGSQFILTLGDMHHLAGAVPVLGACDDLDVVDRIAHDVLAGGRPRLLRVDRGP
ncbi:MAG: peptidylprolyl isomerase [Polyangiaceae bacterium]